MFNYLKWELRNYFYKKYLWFGIIGLVFLLTAIIPLRSDDFFSGLIHIAFIMIIYIALFGSFFVGAKKIVDTFSKKTFLLESMIPQSVKKILLSKFILGIVLNLLYSLITIIGFSIVIVKGIGFENFMKGISEIFENITLWSFLRFSFTYILSTITFMSLVMFGFVLAKVIKPNGKGSKVLGAIIWLLIVYTIGWILASINIDIDNVELFFDIVCIVISAIMYFATAWLIENKLEIYN